MSLYKERRRETENLLKSTRENLERAADLQAVRAEEITRLQAEADTAARWQALSDKKVQSESLWYFLQYEDAKRESDAARAAIAQLENEITAKRRDLETLESHSEDLAAAERSADAAHRNASDAFRESEKELARLEGEMSRIVERRRLAERTFAEAEAALKDALAGATVIGATLQTTQTTASVYDASISEIEIRLAKLEKDRQRYQNLVQRNAATPIQLEQIETEYEATRKKLEATKRQQKAALSGVNEVSHRRESTEAAIQRATAALEMARLNLSYTVVVAPCDGKLGRRALEEGQFITAGQTITYILPDTQKWIVANYKETQVENLHIGQEVTITVDAISDKEFTGTITAISGATGSKYSLVPTDNSAGNFVKIQQRIPVRIDFTNLSKEDNEKLAAGMMVIVKAEL